MKSVFIGGSRAVSRLNTAVRERLDNIMSQHLTVLIGDANGADKAVQKYLADKQYQNVVVYCMESPRNNLGNWPTRSFVGNGGKRDRTFYSIKDRAMAEDATCGFMLWDGESRGTITNVSNLISATKAVLVYFGPEKSFWKLKNFDELQQALSSVGIDTPTKMSALGVSIPEGKLLGFGD